MDENELMFKYERRIRFMKESFEVISLHTISEFSQSHTLSLRGEEKMNIRHRMSVGGK